MYFIYGGDNMELPKTKSKKIGSNHCVVLLDIEQQYFIAFYLCNMSNYY